jgi:hypothetical protein
MTVTASVLAQERLDQVVADKMYRGYNFVIANNYPAENLVGNFSGYTRTTDVQEVSANDLATPSPGSGLKRINITVQWGNAASDQVNLSTLVALY